MKSSSSSVPQLRGARMFTFSELKKITNNFSEANDIGTGSYGKVKRSISLITTATTEGQLQIGKSQLVQCMFLF